MRKYLLPCLILITLYSCQKEFSQEGATPDPNPNPGNPPIGANCKLQQILAIEPTTKKGLYSVFTGFNGDGTANKVEVFDSVANSMDYETPFVYVGDTVKVAANEYFILDGQKRVTLYRTFDNSGPIPDTLTYLFTYNANGYLDKKEALVSGIPIPVVRFVYSWSGDNLVAVDAAVAVPGITQDVLKATLEYDGNAVAKNFIPIFPDGFETSLFVMGLNLGKPSKNLVKKISVTTYDENGVLEGTYVSEYGSYVFSSDGYLTEWTVNGDLVGGSPFVEGPSIFKYFCR